MQINVVMERDSQETLEQLKARILGGLVTEMSVDVTEEAILSVVCDLPRDKGARAEAIGGAILSPIEPMGGGCRFHRMSSSASMSVPINELPAFVPPAAYSKVGAIPNING